MSPQSIRIELIEWLTNLNDKKLLETLLSIKESAETNGWWSDLSDKQRKSIERGASDLQNGKVLTSNQFWSKHGKCFKFYC